MKNSKFLGIVLAAIGVLCLVYPIVASVWIEIVVGACFIAASFFTLLGVSARSGAWDKAYGVLLTVLYLAAGGLMLLNPFEGVMMLMVMLGLVFTFEGVAAIALWGGGQGLLQLLAGTAERRGDACARRACALQSVIRDMVCRGARGHRPAV